MPRRSDIHTILIIGSGPIVIGQACEFDYSGTQACKALTEEGYRVVLVNSNPATIMTDPGTAHRTYVEPITAEVVAKIVERERPDAVLPTLGGADRAQHRGTGGQDRAFRPPGGGGDRCVHPRDLEGRGPGAVQGCHDLHRGACSGKRNRKNHGRGQGNRLPHRVPPDHTGQFYHGRRRPAGSPTTGKSSRPSPRPGSMRA